MAGVNKYKFGILTISILLSTSYLPYLSHGAPTDIFGADSDMLRSSNLDDSNVDNFSPDILKLEDDFLREQAATLNLDALPEETLSEGDFRVGDLAEIQVPGKGQRLWWLPSLTSIFRPQRPPPPPPPPQPILVYLPPTTTPASESTSSTTTTTTTTPSTTTTPAAPVTESTTTTTTTTTPAPEPPVTPAKIVDDNEAIDAILPIVIEDDSGIIDSILPLVVVQSDVEDHEKVVDFLDALPSLSVVSSIHHNDEHDFGNEYEPSKVESYSRRLPLDFD